MKAFVLAVGLLPAAGCAERGHVHGERCHHAPASATRRPHVHGDAGGHYTAAASGFTTPAAANDGRRP